MTCRRLRQSRWGAAVLGAACLAAALSAVLAPPALATAGHISTFAGSLGEGPATSVAQDPGSMAIHGRTMYLAGGEVIRAVDLDTGLERVIAGTGDVGSTGDGGPARAATLNAGAMAVDHTGNLYFVDGNAGRIRRIDLAGRITSVAGGGLRWEDGVPAGEANLGQAAGVAVDAAGAVYVSDYATNRVRRIANGTISAYAGLRGSATSAGDGGPAVIARLSGPTDLAFDPAGNLHIAQNGRVRRVDQAGIITTVAGGGTYPFGSVDIPATDAEISAYGLAFDPAGNLFIADWRWLRKVDAAGRITTVGGSGQGIRRGDGREVDPADGEPATGVALAPSRLAVDASGNVYATEWGRARVRRVATNGIIATVAGNGTGGLGGDGGPAVQSQLLQPNGVAVDRSGNVYIADTMNDRVRKVSPGGTITSLAPELHRANSVTVDDAGRAYVLTYGSVVMRVDPDGLVTRWAGGGMGEPVEGQRATIGWIPGAGELNVDRSGNLYITEATRVRKVDAAGMMTTVVGGGTEPAADGVLATSASLQLAAVAIDRAGGMLLADWVAHRVWRVDADGRLRTVAGTTAGFSGDGGPATSAQLDLRGRSGLAVDGAGQIFVLDYSNHRVRRIDTTGTITTVAGNGERPPPLVSTPLRSGENVPATSTPISAVDIGIDPAGTLYLVDLWYNRIRKVPGAGLAAPPSTSTSTTTSTSTSTSTSTTVPRAVATASAWGNAAYAQLGGGVTADRPAPATVAGLQGVTAMAAGGYHSLAVMPDRTVRSWGLGHVGQLGTGSTAPTGGPAAVAGLQNVSAVAAGAYHSLAVRSDGTVWAWGWNAFGQLGNGTATDSAVPVRVPGLDGVVAVAAGGTHSLALKADGTVLAWGLNHAGQLGTGGRVASLRAVQVPGLVGVASIAAGEYHSAAVRTTGAVAVWGWNGYGQLGDGTTVDRLSPVTVGGLPAAGSVVAGTAHTVVLGRDGSVWTWGLNHVGQLGRSTAAGTAPVPGRVAAVQGVASIASGSYHVMAVRTDGGVAAWGWNAFGQLGDGTTVDRPAPVTLTRLSGVRSVTAGIIHTLAAV